MSLKFILPSKWPLPRPVWALPVEEITNLVSFFSRAARSAVWPIRWVPWAPQAPHRRYRTRDGPRPARLVE